MPESWNLWDVKSPPICTVKTNLHYKEITNLNEVVFDALKTVRDLCYFDKEAAILSRFLYRYRRIFRHEKGIQNLVKISQCLKRYLKLDMSGVLFTFKQSLPFKLNPTSSHAYLPTQQMLKWVLLRFQAFSQVFARLIELTKEVGAYAHQKLCLGWSLNMCLVVFSISARILATSKYLVTRSIEWYSALYKFLPFLEPTSEFLPDYTFPSDLKLWLGKVDLSPLQRKTSSDRIFEFIDLAKLDEEEADEDNEIKIVNEKFLQTLFKVEVSTAVEETTTETKNVKRPCLMSVQYEDMGVPVDVEEETQKAPQKQKRNKKIGKRHKWLKKMNKTLKKYDKTENSYSASGSHKDCNESTIVID